MTINLHSYRSGGATAFYPVTKFYAVILDADGRWAGATGYCKTRASARAAAARLVAKLEG